MDKIYPILFAIIFIPVIIGLRKLTIWMSDRIERFLPSIITLPLIYYSLSKIIQFYIVPDISSDELGFIPSLIMVYCLLSMYALIYLFEKTGSYMCQQQKIWSFFLYVVLSLLSLSMIFACLYDLLNTYYEGSFANVPESDWWEVSLEFLFYSFGIIFANSISNIECVTLWAKLFTSIEVLFSFILLVFFISYYKEIGEIFHPSDEEIKQNENRDYDIEHKCDHRKKISKSGRKSAKRR